MKIFCILQSTSRLKAQRILPPRGMRKPTTIWWRRDSLWTLTSIFWKNTKRSTKALRRWWTCVPWKYGMFTTAPPRSFDQTSLKIWREWVWCHTNSGSAGKVNLWKFRWAEYGKWVSTVHKDLPVCSRRTIFGIGISATRKHGSKFVSKCEVFIMLNTQTYFVQMLCF